MTLYLRMAGGWARARALDRCRTKRLLGDEEPYRDQPDDGFGAVGKPERGDASVTLGSSLDG